MSSFSRGRFTRLVPLVLVALCLLLVFSLQISPSTQSAKSSPIDKDTAQKNDHAADEQRQKERERMIDSRRTVIEPVVTPHDEGLDHLSFTHDIAVPSPLPPWTEEDMQSLQSLMGQQALADLLTVPESMPDFKLLTYQQRVFKSLFQYLDPIVAAGEVDLDHDPKYKDVWALYQKLENVLYPWLKPYYKNAFHLTNTTQGRGIVMCIGNHHFQYAATALRAIREVLKSDLPIEVFYIRENDLSPMRRQYLETEFDNVKTIAVVDRINDWYTRFGGWSLKSYAILASSFSEAILVDADAYFFKKPEGLFDDAGYRKTGTLFFYDRTLFSGWEVGRNWLLSFLPSMSSFVEKTRWWSYRSAHEQESGVVVINKKRSLLGLLATCKMNDKRERDQVTYKHIHGDKESFWIGYEMMQTPYSFIKSYGAVIGGLGDAGDPATVCGTQLHLGVDHQPLWWNGGLLRDKNKWPDRYLTFTHYAEGEDWEFETSCIKNKDRIREFSQKERSLALQYVALDTQRRKDEALIESGEWKPRSKKTTMTDNTVA
ncbi:hypothetical protein LRAMOSA08430 [Lichtheimia ramosa]|uniref:Alpha-1,3-mannosyltransferase n=1 Tax=Lichtheimia ramosa TaxID=688394 RepID=A0A077WGW9_9FUNG|nr:hypothetical protein LRAMOSA08430 [Lichtheimia ramosa]